MAPPREYDILVWGATGFTGSLMCKHLAQHAPADLRWAVAGRRADALQVPTPTHTHTHTHAHTHAHAHTHTPTPKCTPEAHPGCLTLSCLLTLALTRTRHRL